MGEKALAMYGRVGEDPPHKVGGEERRHLAGWPGGILPPRPPLGMTSSPGVTTAFHSCRLPACARRVGQRLSLVLRHSSLETSCRRGGGKPSLLSQKPIPEARFLPGEESAGGSRKARKSRLRESLAFCNIAGHIHIDIWDRIWKTSSDLLFRKSSASVQKARFHPALVP